MKSYLAFKIVITCLLGIFSVSCGQTGPLYLPGQKPPIYVPPEPEPAPDDEPEYTPEPH